MIVDDLRLDVDRDECELSARVRTERRRTERIWYRFSAELHPGEADASPFLPALLLLSMSFGEPLVIDGPVSSRLVEGASRAKTVYRGWWSGLKDIPIQVHERPLRPAGGVAACFFTRGVDSWYSALEGAARATEPTKVHVYSPTADFFFGAPARGSIHEVRARSVQGVREASDLVGADLWVVDTNLRAYVEPERHWGYSHGALLASMGLALGANIGRLDIASSFPLGNLVPLGSHPFLDPLWSTERTEVVHHGSEVTRVAKLRSLRQHPQVLRRLKVCSISDPHRNCGQCPKCVRTVVGLELVGARGRCPTLPASIDLRRVATQVPATDVERAFLSELLIEIERAGGHRRLAAVLQSLLVRDYLRRARRRTRAAVRRLASPARARHGSRAADGYGRRVGEEVLPERGASQRVA